MAVSIVRADFKNVKEKIKEAIGLINYKPTKNKIFIKPNIVNSYGSPDNGVVTHPKVLEAILECFADYEVVIGEGSAVGQNTDEVLQVTGIKKLANKYGVKVLNLDTAERQEVKWKYGSLKIPKIVFTHEYINVPKMKTHHTTQVTLSLKNQKGLLFPKDKKWFHLQNLNDCINALAQVIKPNLVIVDGIICLEGNGPGDVVGKRKYLGLILAGQNAIEVDNVCCQIMGFKVKDIPHIPYVEHIETKGIPLVKVISPFLPPLDPLKKYNCYVHSYQPCSGCLETLSLSLNIIKKSPHKLLRFIKVGVIGRLDFITGINSCLPQNYGKRVICVGDCAKKCAKENNLPLIVGCPPLPEKVVKEII